MPEPISTSELRGDQLPNIVTAPPGPVARQLSERARRAEAPGINTLYNNFDNIFWQEACGANVLDVDGNRYIDFTSGFGVAAVGHRHPAVVDALNQQERRLLHALGDAMGHPLRVELAERLQQLAPVDDPQIYYAVSGADAVEVAIKTLLLATGRQRLLVFEPSYHGLTLGALNASSRPIFRDPFKAHLHSQTLRLPFGCEPDDIERHIRRGDVAGVLVEPIVGREGVLIPPHGWLTRLAELCRHHDVPWVADEIFTGFGRTGRMFAVDHEGLQPDLICCGKALAGGLPIGVVIGRRPLMTAWATRGEALHTATFVAHPSACAAALATLDVIDDLTLVAVAQRQGEAIRKRVEDWPRRFSLLNDVRGRGLLWGLEVCDAATAALLSQRLLAEGLIVLAGGADGRVIQWVPPLTIHAHQLRWAIEAFEAQFSALSNTPLPV